MFSTPVDLYLKFYKFSYIVSTKFIKFAFLTGLLYNYRVFGKLRKFWRFKMKKPIESKINMILIIVLCLLIVFLVIQSVFKGCSVNSIRPESQYRVYATPDYSTIDQVLTRVTEPVSETQNPTVEDTTKKKTEKTTKEKEEKSTTKKSKSKAEPTEKKEETTEVTTEEETLYYATVMTMETTATLQEQWDEGYIVAIDYPDKTYKTFHVELTEKDRDVLEHLCMGEFGSGGFIGAALIAQCVKDAMCFDGYETVEDVRVNCKYDASLDNTPSQEVKNAVSYIFDYDQSAVQHRLMYMYNPYIVYSEFHEGQNYILTYGDVRFFDRWGY